jgi:hypothetical protein
MMNLSFDSGVVKTFLLLFSLTLSTSTVVAEEGTFEILSKNNEGHFFLSPNTTSSSTRHNNDDGRVIKASSSSTSSSSSSKSKNAYIKKLLQMATMVNMDDRQQHHRYLIDPGDNYAKYDKLLSKYFIQFESCNRASFQLDGESYMQGFVTFRFCSTETCDGSDLYHELKLPLDVYLDSTVDYYQDKQEEYCRACDEHCSYYDDDAAADDAAADDATADDATADDDGAPVTDENLDGDDETGAEFATPVCDICMSTCAKINNMGDNFYIDATMFTNCLLIFDGNGNGNGPYYYAGPMCNDDGTKVKINAFTDDECLKPDFGIDVEDYLTDENGYKLKLSHALLKNTYAKNQDKNSRINCGADIYSTEICASLHDDTDLFNKDSCRDTCDAMAGPVCVDNEKRFMLGQSRKSCKWAKQKKTKKRCTNVIVKNNCPDTCGVCGGNKKNFASLS